MAKQPAAGVTQGSQQDQQSQPDQVDTLPDKAAGGAQGELQAQHNQSEHLAPLTDQGPGSDEKGNNMTQKSGESDKHQLQSDLSTLDDKVVVTLLGPYKNYSKGDITSFHDEVAQHLIKSKLATPYQGQELGQE